MKASMGYFNSNVEFYRNKRNNLEPQAQAGDHQAGQALADLDDIHGRIHMKVKERIVPADNMVNLDGDYSLKFDDEQGLVSGDPETNGSRVPYVALREYYGFSDKLPDGLRHVKQISKSVGILDIECATSSGSKTVRVDVREIDKQRPKDPDINALSEIEDRFADHEAYMAYELEVALSEENRAIRNRCLGEVQAQSVLGVRDLSLASRSYEECKPDIMVDIDSIAKFEPVLEGDALEVGDDREPRQAQEEKSQASGGRDM